MYLAITSSVTLPELQQKYPLAHMCRPQNCFLMCGDSAISWCAVFPFSHCSKRLMVTCGYRHEQVHMVPGHVSLHNVHLMLPTDIPDQIAYPRCHFAAQRWAPIFRYPHQMQMDLEYSMRAASVICHASSLIGGARAEAVA